MAAQIRMLPASRNITSFIDEYALRVLPQTPISRNIGSTATS